MWSIFGENIAYWPHNLRQNFCSKHGDSPLDLSGLDIRELQTFCHQTLFLKRKFPLWELHKVQTSSDASYLHIVNMSKTSQFWRVRGLIFGVIESLISFWGSFWCHKYCIVPKKRFLLISLSTILLYTFLNSNLWKMKGTRGWDTWGGSQQGGGRRGGGSRWGVWDVLGCVSEMSE